MAGEMLCYAVYDVWVEIGRKFLTECEGYRGLVKFALLFVDCGGEYKVERRRVRNIKYSERFEARSTMLARQIENK